MQVRARPLSVHLSSARTRPCCCCSPADLGRQPAGAARGVHAAQAIHGSLAQPAGRHAWQPQHHQRERRTRAEVSAASNRCMSQVHTARLLGTEARRSQSTAETAVLRLVSITAVSPLVHCRFTERFTAVSLSLSVVRCRFHCFGSKASVWQLRTFTAPMFWCAALCRRDLDQPQYRGIDARFKTQQIQLQTLVMATSDLDKYHKVLNHSTPLFETCSGRLCSSWRAVRDPLAHLGPSYRQRCR